MSHPASLLVVAGLPGSGEQLGLGDLLRVLSILPSFGNRRIDWCSPPHLYPLVADCAAIGRLMAPEDLAGCHYDDILNLSGTRLADAVNIFDLLESSGSLKQATFDLPALIGARFGISAKASFPVVADATRRDIDVGLNWRVPEPWAIKALPERVWGPVTAGLAGLVCQRQPDTDDLASYIAWVRRCNVLVSPVGLGCHLAMHYGIGLVMLAGPTDFAEAHDYAAGRVLFPPTFCRHRPCCRPAGVDQCGGCMGDHDPAAIVAAVRGLT